MPEPTALVAVDTHNDANLTETEVEVVNTAVQRAIENDEYVFYMIPEGATLDDRIDVKVASSILRYDDASENPYKQARIDEQITNRPISQTQFVGKGNIENFATKEQQRGRPSFAGPPENSNAPPWAGPPENGGGPPENGGGPPENGGGPPENGGGPPENGGGPPENPGNSGGN